MSTRIPGGGVRVPQVEDHWHRPELHNCFLLSLSDVDTEQLIRSETCNFTSRWNFVIVA
jgi:hypothetical protein